MTWHARMLLENSRFILYGSPLHILHTNHLSRTLKRVYADATSCEPEGIVVTNRTDLLIAETKH